MNIGHQGNAIAILPNARLNLLERKRLLPALCGEAHNIGSCIDNAFNLCGRSLHVVGIRVGHRLHTNRILATYDDFAHPTLGGLSTNIIVHKKGRL